MNEIDGIDAIQIPSKLCYSGEKDGKDFSIIGRVGAWVCEIYRKHSQDIDGIEPKTPRDGGI